MPAIEIHDDIRELFTKSNYTIKSLDDEIRASRLCKKLLKLFHQHLLEDKELDPLTAGAQAAGADYTLIDFIIDHQRKNIFLLTKDDIRRFAGHWYITNNLEPNLEELSVMLSGTAAFYRYCADRKLVSAHTAAEILTACEDLSYYGTRIEAFLAISGDGFKKWAQECPL